MGSLVQESMGFDVRQTPGKVARWFGMMVSSLIVMGSSVRAFTTTECGSLTSTYCRRTKWSVSVGVLGFGLALTMLILHHMQRKLTVQAETGIGLVQLIMWCFGVGFITFGESPGGTIGNLYFSAWISFILSSVIFSTNFREYVGMGQAAADENQNGNDKDGHNEEEMYDDAL
jgi:hypothetical protein